MIIRKIEQKDNKYVETLIRTCLIEFGADKPGCAWSDPDLGRFYDIYQNEGCIYYVVEDNNKIVAGCGIGPVIGLDNICELQKMYAYKEYRGTGIAQKLLELCLDFAKDKYKKCYLETFSNMIAANNFYKKSGFIRLDKPIIETEHYACDVWYIKEI